MKKTGFILCYLLLSQFINAQEIEDKIYHLNIMTSIGNGDLTNNQLGVFNGNYSRFGLHLDTRIFKDSFLDDAFLSVGLGHSEFKSNLSVNNQSQRFKNSYIDLPIMINFKQNISPDKKLVFLISGGISINYLYESNLQSLTNNQNFSSKGFNTGGVGRIGFEYLFSNVYYLGFAYHDYRDFNKIEKNGISNNLNNVNALNFSIGFRK